MQKGQFLQFKCQGCKEPVNFSLFDLDEQEVVIACSHCQKKYALNDENLKRQIGLFEALCRQIHLSKEILGDTAVGVDIGEHHVQIPYKLLLTRLTSSLSLNIGKERISIAFRIEPLQDLQL
jgi:DNA-directed RNA polymerase subunit RPC12/RpoP